MGECLVGKCVDINIERVYGEACATERGEVYSLENCCFIGHRHLANGTKSEIKRRLRATIENLIQQGVTSFTCGGSLGFSLLAGFAVLGFKAKNSAITLKVMLPCRDYPQFRTQDHQKALERLLPAADDVICLSEDYFTNCNQQRNVKMLESSQYLVAYMINDGGNANMLQAAKEMGLTVINLANTSKVHSTSQSPPNVGCGGDFTMKHPSLSQKTQNISPYVYPKLRIMS